MPASLTAAIERLRRDGIAVQVVRSAEEAAGAVDPYDRILLIADGAIAGRSQLLRVAEGEGAAVLTVPDASHGELYERIDAASRWAGVAVIDGGLLRETAGMLRDWDLQSTLLRRTLQAGARHLPAEGAVAILDRDEDLDLLERRIVADADDGQGGWCDRLLAPVERWGTSMLMGSRVSPQVIGFAAAALGALAAASFYVHWYRIGLAGLLLATPLEGIARRLARLRMQDGIRLSWWAYLVQLFGGASLVILGYDLAITQGWGMVLLACLILVFLVALGIETGGRRVRGEMLLAERKGLIWLMLPFAALGQWQAGLAALFAYCGASFFWAQHEVHTAPPPPQD